MVTIALTTWSPLVAIMFAQQEQPAQSLPEPVRTMAMMALLGIALLGLLIVIVTLLGGHWVRRWGEGVRRSAVPEDLILSRPDEPIPLPPREPVKKVNDGETLGGDETVVT